MSRSPKPKVAIGLRGSRRERSVVDEATARALEESAERDGGGAVAPPVVPPIEAAAPTSAPAPAAPAAPQPATHALHSVPTGPAANSTAAPAASLEGQGGPHRWQGTITRPHRRRDGVATRVCQYHLPVDLAKQIKMAAAERDMSQSALVTALLRQALSGL